ncbi:unnamed protein product [Dibothriocephalus latus]|uniref:Uncharacterized protein n=1 Tax=Dibothriocephalus latus TaxID=60516 RepID=A0A3P6R3Y7_DIBLA|nr:unnamed protein product [Dibothriocephalus latus]
MYLTIRTIERVHLLCAIIGRWLLPLYGIGTDQITELLLINIGTAADIIDLFEAFSEEAVVKHFSLQVSILCLWQVSLLQFCFNKTARLEASTPTVVEHPQTPDSGQHNPFLASATGDTNQNFNLPSCIGKKTRRSSSQSDTESQVQSSSTTDIVQSSSLHETESQTQSSTIQEISEASSLQETESQTESSDSIDGDCCCYGCFWRNYYTLRGHFVEVIFGTELWTIIMTLLLHDIPFMCLRLTLIFAFAVRSYQNVFFVAKNMVLVLAQIFRCYTLLRAYISKQQLLEQGRLLRPR